MGLTILKGLRSPLSLVLDIQNVKTACIKSFPANPLQVLNLIFDQCINVEWGNLTLKPFYLHYHWS